MWQDFVDSWSLFEDAYLTGWLQAVMLSIAGVVVVAQRQVFLSVAVSQASTLGIALALCVAPAGAMIEHHDQHGLPWLCGICFAVAASVVTAPGRGAEGHADALGAWVFLTGASGSLLLLAHSPHGLEEVQRLMFSSLIGADRHDVVMFGVLAGLTAAAAARWHRTVLLLAIDPETGLGVGLRVRALSLGIAAWIGLLIGSAIHSAGTLYTFGCLVLPVLAARHLCRTMRSLLLAAPAMALATAFGGFVLANHWDYPPAQMAVALQAGVLACAWLARTGRSFRRIGG